MPRHRFTVVVLVLNAPFVLGATGCSDPPTGPEGGELGEVPPITLDWVGHYAGAASGTVYGTEVAGAPIELLITFDQPAAEGCVACVTVTIEDYFHRANLSPQTPTTATWSYMDSGVTHTLSLEKFSAGAVPGTVLLGTLRLGEPDGSGGTRVLVAADLVLERS